eukprot:TRINITY_DN13107_c0_g1_i2.p1 TRINITY_DN13107_c0_g1~~TRINITY_DN13107_c0_g1_i2.p1  ORF type:complete len:472 (+),score=34.59 TRINITY_DN13107_c0_g1_i2:172-1587(+)
MFESTSMNHWDKSIPVGVSSIFFLFPALSYVTVAFALTKSGVRSYQTVLYFVAAALYLCVIVTSFLACYWYLENGRTSTWATIDTAFSLSALVCTVASFAPRAPGTETLTLVVFAGNTWLKSRSSTTYEKWVVRHVLWHIVASAVASYAAFRRMPEGASKSLPWSSTRTTNGEGTANFSALVEVGEDKEQPKERSAMDILRDWQSRRLLLSMTIYGCITLYAYIVMANVLTSVAMTYNVMREPPLVDLGHLLVPAVSKDTYFFEVIDLIPQVALIWGPVYLVNRGDIKRLLLLFFLMGALKILNGISQLVTVLPAPRPSCTEDWKQLADDLGLVPFASWVFTEPQLVAKACNDMIWSGHTESTFLFTLSFMRSLRDDFDIKWASSWFALVPTVFYMVGVIATRIHYTIDLLVAIFATGAAYYFMYDNLRTFWVTFLYMSCLPGLAKEIEAMTDSEFHDYCLLTGLRTRYGV